MSGIGYITNNYIKLNGITSPGDLDIVPKVSTLKYGKNVIIATGDMTLSAEDSGSIIYMNSPSTTITITLPPLASGLNFKFIVDVAPNTGTDYHITNNEGGTIIWGVMFSPTGTAGPGGGAIEGETYLTFLGGVDSYVGDNAFLECDGTKWYAKVLSVNTGGITAT